MSAIKYKVELLDLNSHYFQVSLIIQKPSIQQGFMMPAWIPGSYVIRDFAKQLSSLTFSQDGMPIAFRQTKNNEWLVPTRSSGGALTVSYCIYAFDKSVRGAFLDTARGFFNATSLCLCPVGFESEAFHLEIVNPKLDWQLVTGLTPTKGTNRYEFGCYQAKNYAQLIDCPVLMGNLIIKSFKIQDVVHDIAISGEQEGDFERLAQDVNTLCETQVHFFKTLPKEVDYYCFLLQVSHEGYGGIEHVNSASLLTHKFAIPDRGIPEKTKAYIELLGLFSHEYFHLWMVKQIKPVVFLNYDLTQPNYTTQLWAFEGFTAYYDDLMLVRSGLITQAQYFSILTENMNKLIKTPGRQYQTLKSASFDAWIKFYKPDENSLNRTVSYYLKGALLALCCDLQLRIASNHKRNLDEIMRILWQDYGQIGRGLEEGEIEKLIEQYAQEPENTSIKNLLDKALNQTEELPLEAILTSFGLELKPNLNTSLHAKELDLGVKLSESHGMVLCHEVYQGSIFNSLGIQPGDILVACQDHRVTYQNYLTLFQRYVNQTVNIAVFREGKLVILSGFILPDFIRHLELNAIPGSEYNINKWLLAS